MAKFRGIMVPVTTPLDEGKKIIWSEFETHIEKLLDAGVHAILTPSGTGEFANLTWETLAELTAHAAQAIRGRVPLVSMISDCSTENVLALARLAKEAGADAAMLTPPYFSISARGRSGTFTRRSRTSAACPSGSTTSPARPS